MRVMEKDVRQRKRYLEDIPLEEALDRFGEALAKIRALEPLAGEVVSLEGGMGRVTARPVWARVSSPHYHASAMDGVAVVAAQTHGASEVSPVCLGIGEQAQWVNTGSPLPKGCDAVIMIEQVHQISADLIEIMSPVAPGQHVRFMGEDIVTSELVLPENHLLRPVDIGAAAAAGRDRLEVRRRPRVAILPTGSELVSPGQPLQPGDIIEFNSLMLAGMAGEWGGVATRFPPVPDDVDQLKEALHKALIDHDIVVVNAGSSAGERDYTASVVAGLGTVLVHGIAIRPGHPVVLGVVGNKPVIGIPGYPVSAVLTFELLVKPLIHRLLGIASLSRPKAEAVMSRKVLSSMGQDEFLRVKVGKVGDRLIATPLSRGAGVVTSLVRAEGRVCIPRFSEGVHAGEKVTVELWRSPEEIGNTIVAIGSHDLALDILSNQLHKQYPRLSLSSSNVGSLGGLLALKQGEAHLAGSHLLDEETGEYNIPYVKRLLAGMGVVVVNLVYRQQGLIVARENPKRLFGLSDLTRQGVSLVNRQRGAGTRVLLDFKLKEMGISHQQIQGYDRMEFTHLAVAAAVASGMVDVGLGILAAARALGLDFVPLWKERYDLVMPLVYYESPLLKPLLGILQQASFRDEVESLGGYDTSQMGQVMVRVEP